MVETVHIVLYNVLEVLYIATYWVSMSLFFNMLFLANYLFQIDGPNWVVSSQISPADNYGDIGLEWGCCAEEFSFLGSEWY